LQHQHRGVGHFEPALQHAAGGVDAADQDRHRNDRQGILACDKGDQNAGIAIAGDYGDFAFNMTTAADAHTQDLAILAKHVPNISVAGYWWHTFYPHFIRKSLETRLDTVPLNKIVGFFSDAYHAEWCYPKLKLVKQILEDILVERVDRGWYSLELARTIVTRLLYSNPKAIYWQ